MINEKQFDALLAQLKDLTSAVSSLHRSINENANELHLNLQDVVASLDGSPKYNATSSGQPSSGFPVDPNTKAV